MHCYQLSPSATTTELYIMAVSTEDIGAVLEKEYGGLDQQDQHIDYFYVRVGHQFADKMDKHLDVPDGTAPGGVRPWPLTAPRVWPGLFIDKFPKQGQESERQREERLNKHTRNAVIGQLKQLSYDPSVVHVMLFRACLYTKHDMPVERPISTEQIGAILAQDCGVHNVHDSHINLFYIMIQKEDKDTVLEILTTLETLPGDWRKVEPQKTWPDTFFGLFPKKTPLEMEREREKRLNREVRIPLKRILEQQVANDDPNKSSKIHVMLARACKYT